MLLAPGEGARSGAGGAHARPAAGSSAIEDAERPDVVVDGIVGIGGRPGLRDEAVAALARLDGVPVVAVDLPSGVDADTGELDGPHVAATLTVTFGTHKVALLADPAARGVRAPSTSSTSASRLPGDAAVEALQAADVAALLPEPGRQRAQVLPRRRRRPHRLGARTPAPPCSRSPGRAAASPGWSATTAAPPTTCWPRTPRP